MKTPAIDIGILEFTKLPQLQQAKLLMKERVRQHFNDVSKGFQVIKEPDTPLGKYIAELIREESAKAKIDLFG